MKPAARSAVAGRRLALAALLLAGSVGASAREPLGRLFLSPEERLAGPAVPAPEEPVVAEPSVPAVPPAPAPPPPAPTLLRLDGLLLGRQGLVALWLDGRLGAVETLSASGLRLRAWAADGSAVEFALGDGPARFWLAPGETVSLGAGGEVLVLEPAAEAGW